MESSYVAECISAKRKYLINCFYFIIQITAKAKSIISVKLVC